VPGGGYSGRAMNTQRRPEPARASAQAESDAAAIDAAAPALVAVWDAAREQAVQRVSSSQLQVLLGVQQAEGTNLRSLADSLGMILSSASRLCDRLEAAGMIVREQGAVDRREIALYLTAEGQELLDELRADRVRRLARVLEQMPAAARRDLILGLRQFEGHSGRSIPDDATPAVRLRSVPR
jgi:DNA-binding MarR family transcriptional regulator